MNNITISDVADVVDSLHKTPEYVMEGLPMVRVIDVNNSFLSLSDCLLVNTETMNEHNKNHIPKIGDTIITRVGSYGMVSYINTNEKFCLGQNIAIISPKENPEFLYYYMKSPYIQSIISRNSGGSSYKCISLEEIKKLPYQVEKLNCNKIGKMLYSIDCKIENNNKINEELESMAKTIYDYWFLQFEFPNEEGKPYKSSGGKMVWNEELKREIPEGWEFGSLKNILSELECGNRPKGGCNDSIKDGVPSIGAENIISIGKYDFSTEKYISKDYYLSLKKGIVKSNDVLLYKDGAGVGKSSMAKNNFPYEECAVNSHVFILRTKENNLYQNYLYLTLQKEYIKKILIDLSMKAAQPGLNQPSVESVPILIPSTDIIVRFNNIIDILFNKIFSNSNENKELTSLRDFLLPLLMNGQVEFRELALAGD